VSIPKTRLNSIPLLPSSHPGRLASRHSTLLDYNWSLLYNHFARTRQKTQPLCCWGSVFRAPLHVNGIYSTVSCVFFAAGMYLLSSCLAMNVYPDFTIPAFGRHVTTPSWEPLCYTLKIEAAGPFRNATIPEYKMLHPQTIVIVVPSAVRISIFDMFTGKLVAFTCKRFFFRLYCKLFPCWRLSVQIINVLSVQGRSDRFTLSRHGTALSCSGGSGFEYRPV
jgi:hypothetical protein